MSQCLVSFQGLEAPEWVLSALREGRVPGVCLFAFNFSSIEQFQALTASLHEAAREGGRQPPLVAIDQEGGQLMAVTGGATELPGNMALGATGSADLARAAGHILGTELAALGVNLNLAPVLDLASRPENPVVGLRAFGDDAELVGRLGAAMVAGMQAAGVLACAKHFPGHGNTVVDSHHHSASVDRTLAELADLEMRPFEAAFDVGLAAVMTAHIRYPAIEDVPATFSSAVIGDLLRGRFRYDGLVVTDALDMEALAEVPGPERARRAIEAGADLAVLGHLPGQEEIVARLADQSQPASRLRVERVRRSLRHYEPRQLSAHEDWRAHRDGARAMAQAAITVVTGEAEVPLSLMPGDRMCVVTVRAGNLTPAETVGIEAVELAEQVARRHPNLTAMGFEHGITGNRRDSSIREVVAACSGAACVLLATVDAFADGAQQRLLDALIAAGHRPVLLAMRSPLDARLAGTAATLCSYGRRPSQTDAAVAVLFGEAEAMGTLPIRLDRSAQTVAASP